MVDEVLRPRTERLGMEFSFLAIFAKLLEILIITHLQTLS